LKSMKLRLIITAFIVIAFSLYINPLWVVPDINNPRNIRDHTAVFPDSLISIENEALEGTAFQELIFREGLLYIGEHAFGNVGSLKKACIPNSVKYIADSAFSESGLKTIIAGTSTYAQYWAERHDIEFKLLDNNYANTISLHVLIQSILALFGITFIPLDNDRRRIKQYIKLFVICMRPQDRAELYPIEYRFP